MIASRDSYPLIAELLAEQQRLDTPVARFSRDLDDATATGSPLSTATSRLIPLSTPRPGEQFAFEVDLDSCTGCKSCVAACHALNGLDEEETWRDVGLLISDDHRHPFTQTVTTACHHCADPACLNGCPVLAYEKDPLTGIVSHLDDQCIGCSYCVLKCPYDVPKYSSRLGIVRKCDMCQDRLAHGEAPACAQACPTEAIRIVVVRTADGETRNEPEAKPAEIEVTRLPSLKTTSPVRPSAIPFLPGAPDPTYTRPTTRYVSQRGLPPNLVAGDASALRPQPAHWPLVVLLMFMPMAVGCGVADALLRLPTAVLAVLGWTSGATGLIFSVAHLGQPQRAWKIFLGLRRSWLSREAVVFGLWFIVASAYTTSRLGWGLASAGRGPAALGAATVILGVAGLFCSVMIYVDTRREFWRFSHTAPRFFGSAVVIGLASALSCSADTSWRAPLSIALVVAVCAKLLFEAQALAPLNGDRDTMTPALKTARLLAGPLRGTNEARIACAILGGILLPILLANASTPAASAWLGQIFVIVGELLERSLFFRAVDAPKMPGVPTR